MNDKTTQPLVSICIPSYNAERTIERCLGSIIDQLHDDYEILLVDNCSQDRTVELASERLAGIPSARIVQNPENLGRVENWNRCLELASGTFIKFAFTNDLALPGSLEALLSAIQAAPDAVMVGSRQLAVDSIPESLPSVTTSPPATSLSSREALEFFAIHGYEPAGSLNGLLYKRAPIVENQLWFRADIPYFADFIHTLELSRFGNTVLLDSQTYVFDLGAQGRYHFAGQRDHRSYLLEMRVCTDIHTRLLMEQGGSPGAAMDSLAGRYLWYLSQDWKLNMGDAIRVFRGHPKLQIQMAMKTLRWRLRSSKRQSNESSA